MIGEVLFSAACKVIPCDHSVKDYSLLCVTVCCMSVW